MQPFSEFLRDRVGPMWVAAPRLTQRLRAKGYTVALSEHRYAALHAEWEIKTYGAPLASLHDAAADMLVALKALADSPCRYDGNAIVIEATSHNDAMQRMRDARAAIAKAERRSLPTAATPPAA